MGLSIMADCLHQSLSLYYPYTFPTPKGRQEPKEEFIKIKINQKWGVTYTWHKRYVL